VATVAAVALVSGCAVGPNFRRPDAPSVDRYTRQPSLPRTASTDVAGGEEQRFVESLDIPQQWWTLFQSPPLNALIEKALKANPTLVSAQAALRGAYELVFAQQGLFFPSLQGSFAGTRQKVSQTFSNPLFNPTKFTYDLYTAQVSVGFVPDVFGGNRRQVESLRGLADAQLFQVHAAYVTLTSNVVTAAVQEASLRAQIAATKEVIAISTKALELFRRQFDLGFVARLDVAAQETTLAQLEQALPPLQKQSEINRDLLTALAGRFPGDEPEERFELAALHLPQDLPVSLPSRLVEQRPDVRAAEEQLHAASAGVGVAVAAMLPQFTLAATYGGTAEKLTKMFGPNEFWTAGGSVAQTIFAGGTLLHRKRGAEAAFEQAAAQYRSTVITAFQNVADALYALQNDAASLKAAVAAERAAKVSLDLTRTQQQLGYINYLALLTAEQAYQQTLITRVQAQASRFADTAALFQALGGGWWNRPDERGRWIGPPTRCCP
jgi:NodT family efflux transporter outer membrane factor (OMF) lipoprotein